MIDQITIPTLILAGDSEFQIPKKDTEKLYRNSGSAYKQLHFFEQGKHEDLHKKFPTEFERVVSEFSQNKP